MPGETFNAKATLEADTARFNAAMRQATDIAQKFATQGIITAKQADQIDKHFAAAARGVGSLNTAMKDTAGTRAQTASLAALQQKAIQARTALKGLTDIQLPKLGNNLTSSAQKISQNAAMGTYAPNLAFTKTLENQQKAYQSYSSNILATAKNQSAQEQRLAYQTYAQNMPAALKQAQSAAYATYAQNIVAGRAVKGTTDNLISQRYALYDVARTWAAVSTAILGAAAVSAKVAIDYQRDFATVQRTTGVTGSAIGQLKTQLVDLSTVIPTSFKDIAGIGALGGQLGIASGGIDEFTSVVARLTATTDLTSEAAGTALGRFQALLDVPSNEFENLGSSILKVGINSVATETQIVSIATQISSMGQFAGLTADQVIGLSGALASVGGAPELSRGTITRVFTLISKAVSEGGEKLQNFAAISNVSAAQFAQAWGTEDFATVFQQFLQGIDAEGSNAVATLNELGITSVRDVPLLMRLAGAGEVVQQAFADAASGYADATELGSQFAIIAETISAKLTMLGNTLKGVIASVGEGGFGPLTMLLDIVQKLASALLAFSRNPIGKFFLGAAASAAVFIGVVALIRGTAALAGASLMAMKTAQDTLTGAASRTSTVIKELAVTMGRLALGNRGAAASTTTVSAALTTEAGAAGTATAATRVFGATLKSVLISTGIGAAILGVAWAVEKLSTTFQSASARADAYYGDLSGLGEAIREDTAAYDTAVADAERLGKTLDASAAGFSLYVNKTDEATATLNPFGQALEEASGAQVALNDTTTTTTNSINEQIIAIGEATRTMLATAMANNEKFQETWRLNGEVVTEAGFELQTALDRITSEPRGGETYLQGFIDDYEELVRVQNAANNTTANRDEFGYLTDAAAATTTKLVETLQGFVSLKEAIYGADTKMSDFITSNEIFSGLMGDFGAGLDDGTDAVEGLDAELKNLLDTEYALVGNTASVQSALGSLGESLYENGNNFSEYSEGGRANLTALQSTLSAMAAAAGDDSNQLARMVAGLMQQMTTAGYGAVNELAFVQNYLNQITKGKGTGDLVGVGLAAEFAGIGLGQGFAGGADRAKKSAGSATKTIRTLTDYIKDLSGVFSDAFDIRFGLDQSVDSVADSYQGLIDYADDAAQAVRDAAQSIAESDAKIRGLTAANTTLAYQLTVAQEYGDVLRANEIIAEMAENSADLSSEQDELTDAQKDLRKAQDASSKSLDGGTEASREQRAEVLSLLAAYQDQISALANTGLSGDALIQKTAQLKQQFVDQLRQLGYNESAVQRYAQSFDDLTYAIRTVPRDLTISANANPAIRAVDEYTAHLRTAQTAASALSNTSLTPAVDDTKLQKMARGFKIIADIDYITAQMMSTSNSNAKAAMWAQITALTTLYKSQNYWTGGYTGRGGKYQPMGVVHGGEYVIPKEDVNQSTGLPYANALNNIGATTYHSTNNNYYGGGHVTGNNGIQVVEILPTQVNQIVDALYVRVVLDGRDVATSVNRTNAGGVKRGSN